LLDELSKKIEEQKREIEQRNTTLMAIQRNFESLSVLCKNEKNANMELNRQLASLKEDNLKFLAQIKTLTQQ
jgi:chromosome segregation ATPase